MTWEGAEFARDGEASGALEVRWVGEGEQHLLALQGRIGASLGLWGCLSLGIPGGVQCPGSASGCDRGPLVSP